MTTEEEDVLIQRILLQQIGALFIRVRGLRLERRLIANVLMRRVILAFFWIDPIARSERAHIGDDAGMNRDREVRAIGHRRILSRVIRPQ